MVAVAMAAVAVAVINTNINSINDFFPDNILIKLDLELQKSGWNYGWRSNPTMGYGHWNIDFTNCIIENGLDVSDKLPDVLKESWAYAQIKHFPDHRLIRCYANSHTFGVEGYPHRDSLRPNDKTVIVYMNKLWRREWGGETMIYDSDSIAHAELPKRNKALVFTGNQLHVSRGVTRICPDLRISVMFKITPNSATDADRDRVQVFLESLGADKINHSNRTLITHLLRTYDILKNAGQSTDVCLAGAVHSVFGTNIFKTQLLPHRDRNMVVAVVGEKATYLAEQFSKLDRPDVLEQNAGNIAYDDLCIIECANLIDQNCLDKYPKLNEFWKNKRR